MSGKFSAFNLAGYLGLLGAVFWIHIHRIRIRIQQKISTRIRIQKGLDPDPDPSYFRSLHYLKKNLNCIFFSPQVEVPPSTLSFYSTGITQ